MSYCGVMCVEFYAYFFVINEHYEVGIYVYVHIFPIYCYLLCY